MTPGVTNPGRAKVLWVRVVQQRRRWPAHSGRGSSVLNELSEGGGQPSMNVARVTGTLFLLGIAWEYHR
jgi:hypothetical protein